MSRDAPVRVLICDSSPAYAASLRRLLEADGSIVVAGTHATAEGALAALPAVEPDLLTLDLALPGGFDLVEQLMATRPLPILVIADDAAAGSSRATAALAAGALDAYAKRDVALLDSDGFRRRVRVLARANVIRHPRARLRAGGGDAAVTARAVTAIGIVASSGGPPALRTVIAGLPSSFPVPILVVQHMSQGFTDGFAEWLGGAGGPPVRLAGRGDTLEPGVWVAPEGAHLVLDGGRLDLRGATTPTAHMPSGDVLFSSIARDCGSGGVAVVLSGMGSDGAEGVAAIRAAGGFAIAQDSATSAIFGMPRAAALRGVDLVAPLTDIPAALARLLA